MLAINDKEIIEIIERWDSEKEIWLTYHYFSNGEVIIGSRK